MTNIRTNGFDSDAQRREYMAEAEDYVDERRDQSDRQAVRAEIAKLQGEVRALRTRLAEHRNQQAPRRKHAWLRAGVTFGATLLLGRLSSALNLGLLGKLAAPVIGARLSRLV